AVPPREVRRRRHRAAAQLDRNPLSGAPRSDCAEPGEPSSLSDCASAGDSRGDRGEMNDFASTPGLTLLPAVDVADGKAVRLTQGEAGSETSYGDPVEAAEQWRDQGAEWIHLVDL